MAYPYPPPSRCPGSREYHPLSLSLQLLMESHSILIPVYSSGSYTKTLVFIFFQRPMHQLFHLIFPFGSSESSLSFHAPSELSVDPKAMGQSSASKLYRRQSCAALHIWSRNPYSPSSAAQDRRAAGAFSTGPAGWPYLHHPLLPWGTSSSDNQSSSRFAWSRRKIDGRMQYLGGGRKGPGLLLHDSFLTLSSW